jgi:hypothetical protein
MLSGRLWLVTIPFGVLANTVKLRSSLLKCSQFLRYLLLSFFDMIDRNANIVCSPQSYICSLQTMTFPMILACSNFRLMVWTYTSMVMITVCNTSSALTGIASAKWTEVTHLTVHYSSITWASYLVGHVSKAVALQLLLTSLILAFLMFMSEYDFEILGMNLA